MCVWPRFSDRIPRGEFATGDCNLFTLLLFVALSFFSFLLLPFLLWRCACLLSATSRSDSASSATASGLMEGRSRRRLCGGGGGSAAVHGTPRSVRCQGGAYTIQRTMPSGSTPELYRKRLTKPTWEDRRMPEVAMRVREATRGAK